MIEAAASAVPLTVGVVSFVNAEDVIATAGAVVSTTNVCVTALDVFVAASVAVTDTELLPLASIDKVPLSSFAVPVSTDQVPPVAVVV